MKINEGNIFETMRLVLPEHRGIMKGWQQQRGIKKPPRLSQQELEDMQYTVSEAVQNGSKVGLMLFGEYEDTTLEGILMFDGRLRIRTHEGVQAVDVKRLIRVEVYDM